MNKKMSFVLIAIEVILLTLCFVMLPQQVIVQVGFDGSATNIVSKTMAMAILLVLAAFAFVTLFSSEKSDVKGYLIAGIFIFVTIFTLVINCL